MMPHAILVSIFLMFLCAGVYCCTEGDLRLTEFYNITSVVQVCAAGEWTFICGNNWFRAEATVTCQQMGHKAADTFRHEFPAQLSEVDQHIGYMNCAGVESHLLHCSHSGIITPVSSTCRKDNIFNYATVTCVKEEVTNDCDNGDVRIINDVLEGCFNGKWNHIYITNEESWTEQHARVACRQLGLNPEGADSSNTLLDGASAPSIDYQYHCFGHEESLHKCAVSSSGLTAALTAGISCGDMLLPPSAVELKLTQPLTASLTWEHNESSQFNIHCSHHHHHSIILRIDNSTSAIIKGLLPNAEYTCCISAQYEQAESSVVCKMLITGPIAVSSTSTTTSIDTTAIGTSSTAIGMITSSITTIASTSSLTTTSIATSTCSLSTNSIATTSTTTSIAITSSLTTTSIVTTTSTIVTTSTIGIATTSITTTSTTATTDTTSTAEIYVPNRESSLVRGSSKAIPFTANRPIQSMANVDSSSVDGEMTWSSWIGGVTIGLAGGIVITIVVSVITVVVVVKRRVPDGSTAFKNQPIIIQRPDDPSSNPVYMFSRRFGIEPEYNNLHFHNNNGLEPQSIATYELPQPHDLSLSNAHVDLIDISETPTVGST